MLFLRFAVGTDKAQIKQGVQLNFVSPYNELQEQHPRHACRLQLVDHLPVAMTLGPSTCKLLQIT